MNTPIKILENHISRLLNYHSKKVTDHSMFTENDVCFHIRKTRTRPVALPPDAVCMHLLIEQPQDDNGIKPWEGELTFVMRGGRLWNPDTNLRILRLTAPDTEDVAEIEDRYLGWVYS